MATTGTRSLALTAVQTFKWNPSVASYVVSTLQVERKAGEAHGVQRVQTRYLPARNGWEVRITATDAGFDYVRSLVPQGMAAAGVDTALPY